MSENDFDLYPGECCLKCYFWRGHRASGAGECRRHSPIGVTGEQWPDLNPSAKWPTTRPTDRCGDYSFVDDHTGGIQGSGDDR